MKLTNQASAQFVSRYRRAFSTFIIASAASVTVAHADSTTDAFKTPNTSLLKSGNWANGVPTQNITGTISESASGNPLGWNNNSGITVSGTNGTATIGDLDFISGSTNLVVGVYSTVTAGDPVTTDTITLAGSTLNSQANTILANSSGNTITFENDVAPSGDLLSESAVLTYALGSTTNVIQSTAGSNIIIDNKISGSGDAVTFLGGGVSGTSAGATLELGAGSANDVVGGAAANAPTPANAGSFSSTAVVQTADANTFTGGLTIGDTNGVANAGTVKVDGANALPTTGTVTVNKGSQLLLNGNASYGGAAQSLVLNGTGTGSSANGALSTMSGNTSTWAGTVNVASTSAVDVVGSTGTLAVTGAITGSGQLQSVGAGKLTLNGSSTAFTGGVQTSAGSLVAGNANAFGTGAVTVAGGALSTALTASINVGTLSLTSGSITLNTQSAATFSLSLGSNFSMSGGTLDLTYNLGMTGSIYMVGAGSGGSFSISGGTLNLGGSAWNYANSYDIFNNFGSGSVSGLTIDGYDSTDYTASVSNAGVLSFAAVPEPSSWGLGIAAVALFAGLQLRRRASGLSA